MRTLPYTALSLALVSTVSCFSEDAAQIPWDTGAHEIYWSSGNRAWDAPPDPDTTSQFIFSTVDSLLQRLPNNLYRNGTSCGQNLFFVSFTTNFT